jgi:hypothetical protein
MSKDSDGLCATAEAFVYVAIMRPMVYFRAFHAAFAVEMLLAIAYVCWYALSGRRRRLLHIAAASLIGATGGGRAPRARSGPGSRPSGRASPRRGSGGPAPPFSEIPCPSLPPLCSSPWGLPTRWVRCRLCSSASPYPGDEQPVEPRCAVEVGAG